MMDVVPQLETCRICAKCYLSSSSSDFLHLFQPQEDKQCDLDFVLKEIDCWQLKIAPNDGLPQQICSNCFQKFCTIASFRQECVAAQDLLHKARQMTESQAQQNITLQKLPQQTHNAFLLPSAYVLASAQPITQQICETVPHVANTLPIVQTLGQQSTHTLAPQQITTAVNLEENIIINTSHEKNQVPTTSINRSDLHNETTWDEAKFFTEVIAQEADTTTQSSIEEYSKRTENSDDLEEVLEGSIIPKDLNGKLSHNSVLDESQTNECGDDAVEENVSKRIAKYEHACNYCYCPAKGPIKHLVFESSEDLSQHFFDVHDPKLPYPCPNCPKLFATMANRNKHYDSVHANPTKVSKLCTFCNKRIQTTQKTHEKNCTYIADWHCKTCKKNFIQMPLHSFRAHQRSHSEVNFPCDICNLVFSQLSLLLTHKKSHRKPSTSLNKKDFKCMTCKQVFNSMFDLKCHEYSNHNGEDGFRCKFCKKGYSTFALLRSHMEISHPDETNLISLNKIFCPKCKTAFQSKTKLHYHMQRTKYENGRCNPVQIAHKSRIKSFVCGKCLKYFNSKEQLEVHLETHDVRLRPFGCEECSVRCRTAIDLKEHDILAHSKMSAFECETCGEKFAYRKDLETHKLYHAKLLFKCKFKDCSIDCTDEKTLEKHMRTHETVSCEYCAKLFTTNDIEAHIKSSHNKSNNDLESNFFTKSMSDFSFNQNHFLENDCYAISAMQETPNLEMDRNANNICAPYVEPMESGLLNDSIIFEEQDLLTAQHVIANNVDFIMSEEALVNDSFINSLLETDYNIVAN